MPMSSEEYVAKDGAVCPVCRCGGNLEAGRISGDATIAYSDVSCGDCGATWTDHWLLKGYGELEEAHRAED